jgi:uncharacterized membrane protein
LSKKNKHSKTLVGEASKPTNKSLKENSKSSIYLNLILKPQSIFLVLATIFGLSFVFTIPPFQVPDEAAHMFRAYELSRLHLKLEEKNNVFGNYLPPAPDNKVTCGYIPSSFDSAQRQFFYLKFQPNNKTNWKTIKEVGSIKLNPENEKFTEITAGAYSFFGYIPQIPALIIGRILNFNVLSLFYLGRIFALAFFILCVWYSIRILPFGQHLFIVLALIPMTMTLAGSYSVDSVTNSLSFLALALIFNLMFQQGINFKSKKLVLLIVLLSLFGVLKIIYFPWIILLLLIPRSAFEKAKYYYFSIAITFLSATLLYFGWQYLISINQITNPNIITKKVLETPSYQLHRILDNPALVFDIISETFKVKGDFYYKSLIGVLGYLDTLLPRKMYGLYYFLLLAISILDFNKKYTLSIYQRGIIVLFTLGVFIATIFGMFISDGIESKQSLVVEGVQGRYFIPALIVGCFSLYGLLPNKLSIFQKYKFPSVVVFLICLGMLYKTQHTLHLRYYVHGNEYYKYISK